MKIKKYDVSRDLNLYIEGSVDAFRESFPGVSMPQTEHSNIVNDLKAMTNTDFLGAYTAVLDNEPLGFVIVSIQPFYLIEQGYIESVFVYPQYRRRGISNALLQEAESWSRRRGARSIKLDVSLVNDTAVQVYEASGYIKTRVQMDKSI